MMRAREAYSHFSVGGDLFLLRALRSLASVKIAKVGSVQPELLQEVQVPRVGVDAVQIRVDLEA
jgi:hypothetical protein